jgi:hypothetical protein
MISRCGLGFHSAVWQKLGRRFVYLVAPAWSTWSAWFFPQKAKRIDALVGAL